MISTQLMRLAEMNQWKVNAKEDMIYGEYNGFLFTAFEGKHFKAFITPVAGISPDALDMIVKFLENQRKTLKLRNYEIGDNFLCVRMEEGIIPISSEKVEYILGQLSGLLSLYEVPARSCVVCGQTAQRKGLYLGLFCHLHQECEDKDMVDFTRTEINDSADDVFDAAPDEAPVDTMPDEAPVDAAPDEAPVDAASDEAPVDAAPDETPVDAAPVDGEQRSREEGKET